MMDKPNSGKTPDAPSSFVERLFRFAQLFDYAESNDRAIVIVGSAFLDAMLTDILTNFLVDDAKEVGKLLRPEGAIGSFGARISTCYCLGLVGQTVTADLRLVAKIRNRFAHEVDVQFSDSRIRAWCEALQWHRFSMMADPPPEATTRDLFQVGVHQLVTFLNGRADLARHERRLTSKDGVAF